MRSDRFDLNASRASVLDLKFACSLDRLRSELQIQEAH